MPDRLEITSDDVDAVVGWTVIRAARRAARLLGAALAPHSLTPVEFGVLVQLAAARGELTQAEVARAVEIRPQSVAPVIEGLNGRGLLNREGERGRGRSGRLLLSDAGSDLLQAALPALLATNPAFQGGAENPAAVNRALLAFLEQEQGPKER